MGLGNNDGNKKPRAAVKKQVFYCQVDGCSTKLSNCKAYCVRYRVCQQHLAAASVCISGVESRFCQQCGRFQELTEFDGTKRSCRTRLAHHNNIRQQRRKEAATAQLMSSSVLDLPRSSRPSAARQPGTFGSLFASPPHSPEHTPEYSEYEGPRHSSLTLQSAVKPQQEMDYMAPGGRSWQGGAAGTGAQAARREPSPQQKLGSSRWTEATAAEFFTSKANKRPWSEQQQQGAGMQEQQRQRCHQQQQMYTQQQGVQPAYHQHLQQQHQHQHAAMCPHQQQQQQQHYQQGQRQQQQAPVTVMLQPSSASACNPAVGPYAQPHAAIVPVMGLLEGTARSPKQSVLSGSPASQQSTQNLNPIEAQRVGAACSYPYTLSIDSGALGASTPHANASAAAAAGAAGMASNSNNSSPSTASEQGQVQMSAVWTQQHGHVMHIPDTGQVAAPAVAGCSLSMAVPGMYSGGNNPSLMGAVVRGPSPAEAGQGRNLMGPHISSSSYEPTYGQTALLLQPPRADSAARAVDPHSYPGAVGNSSAPNELRCDSTGSWVGQHNAPSLSVASAQHGAGIHSLPQMQQLPWVGSSLHQADAAGSSRLGCMTGAQIFSPRVLSTMVAGSGSSRGRMEPGVSGGAAGADATATAAGRSAPWEPSASAGMPSRDYTRQQFVLHNPVLTTIKKDPMLITPRPVDNTPKACGTANPACFTAVVSPFAGGSYSGSMAMAHIDRPGLQRMGGPMQQPGGPQHSAFVQQTQQQILPVPYQLMPARSTPSQLTPADGLTPASSTQPDSLTRHLSLPAHTALGYCEPTASAQYLQAVLQDNAGGEPPVVTGPLLTTWSSTSSLERILNAPLVHDWATDGAATGAMDVGGLERDSVHETAVCADACMGPSTVADAHAGPVGTGGSSILAQRMEQRWMQGGVSTGREGSADGLEGSVSQQSSDGDTTTPAGSQGAAGPGPARGTHATLHGSFAASGAGRQEGSNTASAHAVQDWQGYSNSMGSSQGHPALLSAHRVHAASVSPAASPMKSSAQHAPCPAAAAAMHAAVGAGKAHRAEPAGDAWTGFADGLLADSTEGHVADLMKWAADGADIEWILSDKGM